MHEPWHFLTASVMAALLMLTACAEFRSQFQESPEDQQITRAVQAALAADTTPTLSQVNVSTTRGRVMLTGWARAAAAERARQIARSVAGVRGVVDFINVPERIE
ncbi:MAG TPA: BON domain-containing protein [Methylomirabilota bacterium]|jgi:osmotically-inducible protein OsmY|nr:BON domain-containing protein [Methylomirabilota bacterium]